MKINTLLLLMITACYLSCGNPENTARPKKETPKPLQDKNADVSLVSKRGDGDLTEALYNELVSKSAQLQALEKDIEEVNIAKSDSAEAIASFLSKNNSYYNSATTKADLIQDSLLKKKIIEMINTSKNDYTSNTRGVIDLINGLDKKSICLNDYHTFLKIYTTLPLIKRYQKENMPDTKPVQNVRAEYDKIILKIDSMSSK